MRISDWSSDVCSSDLHQVVDEGLMQTRAVVAIDEARSNGGPQRDVKSVWLGLRHSPDDLDVEAPTDDRGVVDHSTTRRLEKTQQPPADGLHTHGHVGAGKRPETRRRPPVNGGGGGRPAERK